MNKEIWKDIKGYEGLYRISNYGNVYSLHRERLMTPVKSKRDKTVYIYLSNKLSIKGFILKNLVYCHFIWSFEGMIDNKDGDFTNCRVDNLISVPYTYRFKKINCIRVLDTDTQELYESITILAKKLGVTKQSLSTGLSNPNSKKYKRYKVLK